MATCFEGEVVYAWEENLKGGAACGKEQLYGCLNEKPCCAAMRAALGRYVEILAVVGFVAALGLLLAAWAARYIVCHFLRNPCLCTGKVLRHRYRWAVLLLFVLVAVGVACTPVQVPTPPHPTQAPLPALPHASHHHHHHTPAQHAPRT